ncbi:MAG: IMP dehydrogenase [Phycisphaerales bacterium]|nr:IMP dehydrogenase [Phycisphaerales bacterium]
MASTTRLGHSKIIGEAITFDDVLVVPAYSEIHPRDAMVTTTLSEGFNLHIPIVSAAMDTVTEVSMSIAMAREGGLGFIHKNMPLQQQVDQIKKVKRSESWIIYDPITLYQDATIADAIKLMTDNKIGGIPIVDKDNVLVGILTSRDLRFHHDVTLPVSTIMTKENLIVAHKGTDLKKAETILKANKIEKIPIVDDQRKLVGLITYRDMQQVNRFPNSVKDAYGRLRVGVAVGITSDAVERVSELYNAGVDAIALDSAHGHSQSVINTLKLVRAKYPNLPILAGNVATGAGALALAKAGATAIKVGIGPGSICTTRIVAGAGVPQITAIMDVAQALENSSVKIVADGGIRYSGDIVKAIVAGADMVMLGGLLAGTDESPGEVIIYNGRKFKEYRGMGSVSAMSEGSSDRYFQDHLTEKRKLVPEGIEGRVAYKGYLSEVIHQFVGGLKAGMGYCGAHNIEALKKANFIKVTNAGIKESHAHDIEVTKEAPNYSI